MKDEFNATKLALDEFKIEYTTKIPFLRVGRKGWSSYFVPLTFILANVLQIMTTRPCHGTLEYLESM